LFFSMPQDSLITLSAQRPVWLKILSYLPMAAKKNLRLSHPREFKDIIRGDPSWIWTVNLGDQIQYPDYFYESETPLRINFPREEDGFFILNPDISDQMIELIDNDKIKPRIVGLAVHQETLNSFSNLLRIEGLHFIEIWMNVIQRRFQGMSEIAMQLLTSNRDSLQEITLLRYMYMDDNISHMLNSVTFHNVKKLQLIGLIWNLSKLLLRACPNVQYLVISRDIDIEDEDGLMLTSVKKMELENTMCTSILLRMVPNVEELTITQGGYRYIEDEDGLMLTSVKKMNLEFINGKNASILLRMVPNVEELTITGGTIAIRDEDFSLLHLTKLSLKKVKMRISTSNILKEKLPEALKLEDCMDWNCRIYQ